MTRVEVLRPFVEEAVKEFLGVEELQVLDDGSIPIRAGSTRVIVRLVQANDEAPPLLEVFAPILHGVKKGPELLEALNEMNASFTSARAFWANDQVVIAMEILGETLDKQQVAYACGLMSFAADRWDDVLKQRFGGEVAFSEPPAAEGAEQTKSTPAAPPAEAETEAAHPVGADAGDETESGGYL